MTVTTNFLTVITQQFFACEAFLKRIGLGIVAPRHVAHINVAALVRTAHITGTVVVIAIVHIKGMITTITVYVSRLVLTEKIICVFEALKKNFVFGSKFLHFF
jgi:hypothetical protein